MHSLGINIGSSSIKIVMLEGDSILWHKIASHEGSFIKTLRDMISSEDLPADLKSMATGTEGRHLLNMYNAIEPLCIEEAIKHIQRNINAVVSLGGEDLVVYITDENSKIITSFSGNKCASGTGEFFKQQLGRMDMGLDDIHCIRDDSRVLKMSSRCSVFMKSDCTHKLNKGEAHKDDIVLSLSDVMATKVMDFLQRAHITKGRVLMVGGVTQNKYIVKFIQEKFPDIEFIVPPQAPYFEAYGAALLARNVGSILPEPEKLFRSHNIQFGRYENLKTVEHRVKYLESRKTKVRPNREYILGVDGGSTTTKACLVDMETDEITASYYGRTHGDPVNALKQCLKEIKKQLKEEIGDEPITINLASTTGSSREILGVFLETSAVYNEIIAHAVGTTFYNEDIDTIFEIGGQDAKYVFLKNKVPIDYAMNEACSAGTGSFLEESAQGDLNIQHAHEIGPIALAAEKPLKFGEHCSAFINSDIRKAIQQGATREDITAGIITSIVSNYLNRVVGNRSIGNNIVLQGGVAKNQAVPLAFAMLLNKNILVPPDPELMGCFGVAILAKSKLQAGLIEKKEFSIDAILNTEIIYEREFKCNACENYCTIRVLNVNGHKYMFGGRCNKYANMRKKKQYNESEIFNYVDRRMDLLLSECAPDPEGLDRKRDFIIGIPKCFSIYTLYPLYSWFFHELGIETILSKNISHEGTARIESSYCFPAEIAHGATQDIYDHKVDFIFVPHFRDMPSYEDSVHANFCPITQALPYYIKKAFPEIPPEKFLSPVVSFKFGKKKTMESFISLGKELGFSEAEIKKAFDIALKKQQEYFKKASDLGKKAYEEAKKAKRPVIAILGRPYNAFTSDANMGIPKKFTTRGYSVIPFDILPYEDETIFSNMYWYYGQQDMKSCSLIKDDDNIYITYISNFSCAPDSFMLHYVKWIMGTKPFLILELDSHSADAGVDTRVEAFLDIIEGYKSKLEAIKSERYDNGLRFINNGKEEIHIKNVITNEKIRIKNNPKVKLLLSNMGRLSSELIAATVRSAGWNAQAMPVPTIRTLQMARDHASGKECVPSQLVLGSALQFFSGEKYRKDEIYLLFVPITSGPCRTGQYYVFYENLFKDMRLDNVVIFILSADNSYTELGASFSKNIWWAAAVADYMKDIESTLRTCAADPHEAIKKYDEIWHTMIHTAETDMTKIIPVLKEVAHDISAIPLKRNMEDCPKVLIVGEIYVRRDDFAVDELIQNFSKKGIIGKVSGITEWIHYLDFVREYDIKKRLRLMPFYRKIFSKEFKKFVKLKIEKEYKRRVEHKIKNALNATNLIPDFPHNMYKIMDNTEKHFVNHELNSEIAISTGVAATAMSDGYSGVVNISPFACLIGRVIEGLYTPWARRLKYPLISVEVDGNIFPPNVINKLEIFMLNVLRFRKSPEIDSLVEKDDTKSATLSRVIIRD
ncbi:acyl-CoA dehydratase activase [Spirochaetota bacterium]